MYPAQNSRQGDVSSPTAIARHDAETSEFAFPVTGAAVRVATIDGAPWFVAADVAAILGLGNMHSSLALLDDDERGLHSMDTPSGVQQIAIVSEPGLYSLMLRSRKPEAKAFKRWVVHDVLPAIRRTGSYAIEKLSPRELAQLVIAEADRADQAEKQVAELEPAADNWNVLADAEGDYSLREAALMLKRSGVDTGQNRLMTDIRRLAMVDARGRPYARYNRYLVERPISYTHPRTGEPMLTSQIRVTVEGIAYLWNRLAGRS